MMDLSIFHTYIEKIQERLQDMVKKREEIMKRDDITNAKKQRLVYIITEKTKTQNAKDIKFLKKLLKAEENNPTGEEILVGQLRHSLETLEGCTTAINNESYTKQKKREIYRYSTSANSN